MSSLLKNLIIALGITLLLGVVYYFTLGTQDGDLMADSLSAELDPEIARRTAKILSDTQEINRYKLDTSIFEDSRFISLKNLRVELQDVDTGRVNPFESVQ